MDRIGQLYDNSRPRFHLPLNFRLLDTKSEVASLAANIDKYFNSIPDGAWLVWILGGHDEHRIDQARVAPMFSLPATPIFHAGDEIGMANGEIPRTRPF